MKKLNLSLLLVVAMIFIGCSNDDNGDNGEDQQSTCSTCTLDLLGTPITSEYCDNGDGTVTVTTEGVEQTADLDGLTFEQFVSAFEQTGATCN